jgi:hypothetical protein
MSAGHHPYVATHLKVGPKNVETLAKHIFKDMPKFQHIVEKYFPTQKFLVDDLPPPEPKNLLFHPPF